MAFTLDDIKLKITTKVNDPEGNRYGNEAIDAFILALEQLILQGVKKERIPLLSTNFKYVLNVVQGVVKISFNQLGLISVDNIESDQDLNTSRQYHRIDNNVQFNNIKISPKLLPYDKNEIYWNITGNEIRFITEYSVDEIAPYISGIMYPTEDIFGSSDLVTVHKFDQGLIQQAIENAARILLPQISEENPQRL